VFDLLVAAPELDLRSFLHTLSPPAPDGPRFAEATRVETDRKDHICIVLGLGAEGAELRGVFGRGVRKHIINIRRLLGSRRFKVDMEMGFLTRTACFCRDHEAFATSPSMEAFVQNIFARVLPVALESFRFSQEFARESATLESLEKDSEEYYRQLDRAHSVGTKYFIGWGACPCCEGYAKIEESKRLLPRKRKIAAK
jgi:hypothetical protein